MDIFNLSLIYSSIRLTTPLLLAALGGLYSERAGVINIALEGLMLAGAFTAGLVLFRQQRQVGAPVLKQVPAGENHPGTISLERLRESGY